MLVYPKIAREVLSFQAVFMLGCGRDVKNLGPAMLVYQNKGAFYCPEFRGQGKFS